jgi:hypothetical protein
MRAVPIEVIVPFVRARQLRLASEFKVHLQSVIQYTTLPPPSFEAGKTSGNKTTLTEKKIGIQ